MMNNWFHIYGASLDFNTFLHDYGWIFAVALAGIILIVVGIIVLTHIRKKPKKRVIDESAYYDALGGKDNLIGHELVGSRIKLELKDYDAIDKQKLTEAGVDGFIMMSNRLTLVIKGDAKEVYERLFGVRE